MRDCTIEGCDGTALSGDLFLPRTERPVPCLVTLLPYHKDGLAGVTGWQANHFLASAGYASLVVDSRGTGASAGRPRSPFHPGEADDAAAVIGWAAGQEWCDGGVGLWGVSYAATTALRTAALRPPALRAVAAVMAMLDPERDFIHPGGQPGCLASLGMWGLSTLAQHLTPPLRDGDDVVERERRWRERLDHGRPFLLDLLEQGPGDPAWRERVVEPEAITLPVLCATGWRDLTCDPTVSAYERLAGPRQLLVGPWLHTLPDDSPIEPVGFLPLAVAWWDRWLRPAQAGPPPEHPVAVHLQGRGRWLALPDWPAAHDVARMSASADARLVQDFPPVEGTAERAIDPTVGARSGLWSVPARFGPRRDQHEDDARSLAFTSDPLERPLAICGRPVVHVDASADGPGTLVVRLAHVEANGVSTLITSGVADHGTPRVELTPTAYEVPAGDRVRLIVAGADFPRVWPSAGATTLQVRCPGTTVELPLLSGDVAEPDLPAPAAADAAPSLVLRADPLYTVSADALRDATTVAVGDHLVLRTPLEEHELDIHQFVTASVAAGAPGGARLAGRSTTRVTTARGRYVVRAEIELTADGTRITGEVTRDGTVEHRLQLGPHHVGHARE